MSTVVKDLGAVSAYAYAVEKGYTGTEAEFAELMADYAEVGQRAEDAADSALESKTAAQTAATTATNKASEATTAAQTATTKATEAQADADAAALDASQAMSAASTATSKATEATTAAATAVSSKDAAVSANTAAQSAKTAAQTAQQGAETARDAVQSSAAQITTNAEDITQLKEDLNNALSDITTKTGNPLTFVDFVRHGATASADNATLIVVYGTQLFNANAWQNKTGVSSVADGVITFNGTNSTGSSNNIVSTPYLPKGKYTVKIEAMDSDTKYCRFSLRKADNTALADTNAYLQLPYEITMNPTQDVYKMSAIAKHESTDTNNIGAIRITINSGESVGNYEDYIGVVYDVSDTIYTVPGNNFIVADTVSDITLSYFQLISSKYLMDRIDSNTEAISVLNDNTIVKRNNDVATKVDACSSYGLKTADGILRHTLSILCMTDVHSKDFDEIRNAVVYLNDNDSIDIGVCLGDMAPSKYTDPATDFIRYVGASDKPYYTILGNHDTGNNTSLADSTTIANAFAKWVKDTTSIENLSLPYYKVDTDYGITLIFLNNYDVPDTVSEGAYTVSRGAEVVSQTQIDWLLSTLDNVPTDNTVVVLRHSFPDANTRVDCNFSMKSRNLQGSGVACYTDIVPDIINAWKNGTALNKTYSPNVSGVTASVVIDHNFATRGSGKFACYIVGHAHRDVVAKSTTYPDQIAIGFESSSYGFYQNGLADLPRVMGQKSQDAITVVSIDPTEKLIKMVRIGSNCTVDMVDRTMIAIDY